MEETGHTTEAEREGRKETERWRDKVVLPGLWELRNEAGEKVSSDH